MNKMKKLLSVILAVVLAFSALSVLGSAKKTDYKTVADLEALSAYSPYGQVTRLTAEERMSIIGDTLDILLAQLNINMGTVLDVLGLTVTINLTSIDNLCASFDSFYSTMDNWLYSIAKGIVNLGILEDITFDSWQTGMSRDGTAQLTIAFEVLELLASNTGAVNEVLTNGLELGIISSFISGLDLSDINTLIKDLPSLLKGMVFPMFERWDQTLEEVNALEEDMTGNGKVLENLDWVVNNYFTRPMSLSTVKATADGTMTSKHTGMPTGDTHRRKFVWGAGNQSVDVYQYYTQSDVDDSVKANKEDDRVKVLTLGYNFVGTYYLEQEMPGSETYVYKYTEKDLDGNVLKNPDGTDVKTTLKHYEDGSYWLPDMYADGVELHVTQETAIDLLYKMIPYVFDEMAPTVLNGSVKKLLAGLFGVKWENLGLITDPAVLANVQTKPGYDASLEVFGEQGEYLWEWSAFDYIAPTEDKNKDGEVNEKDATFYYRYEDQIFIGDASNANDMINIIKWDFRVTGDFMNEFIPGSAAATTAGNTYTHLMMSFNNFLVKAANLVLDYDVLGIEAPVTGTNDVLVSNIKNVAQAVIKHAPETIFGTPYEGTYYDLITSTGVAANKGDIEDDLVLTGIAALLIDALAPQAHMPTAQSLANQNVKVGALLAAIVRELATQILPSVDYDSLIYTSYDNSVFLAGKDNSYWLDVLMTIATDLGLKYLTAFSDMWEDGSAWTNLGYSQTKTYALADFEANPTAWENKVDYIIDWALTVDDGQPVWNMLNLLDMGTNTINMSTNEDPWLKLDTVLDNLLFLDQFTTETDLEVGLRGTILDLVDLNWGNILGTPDNAGIVDIPANSKLRTTNLVDALSLEVRDLINGLLKKVGGGSYELIPTSSVNNIDDLVNQANIRTIAVELVGHLDDAYNAGLLQTGLPFLNLFLGWKMDPQVIADPFIRTDYRDGGDYVFAWNNSFEGNSIKFTNNSSGMLEKHRDTATVDHEYAIEIESATHDGKINSGMTIDVPDKTASPYETISLNFAGTYGGEEAVLITIKYSYIGKDGQPIGGTLTKQVYALISNQYEDAHISGRLDGDNDKDYASLSDFKRYVFTEDIKNTVENYRVTIAHKKSTTSDPTVNFQSISYPDGAVYKTVETEYTYKNSDGCDKTATASAATAMGATNEVSNYFTGISNNSEAGWATALTSGGTSSTAGKLYKATGEGLTTAEEDMPYGVYNIGAVGVKYKSDAAFASADTKVICPVFIHYNDYDIGELYDKHMGYDIYPDDVAAEGASAYAAYTTALKNVVKLAKYPMMTTHNQYINGITVTTVRGNGDYDATYTYEGRNGGAATTDINVDYVKGIMPQIPDAIEALETAYEALKPYLEGGEFSASAEGASTAELESFLEEEGKDEVNFQDYKFYEYFNFADRRTAARELVASLKAPEVLDQYYIDGSGIREAELDKVIAAETNANIAAGITASRSENDAQAIYDSQVAHDTFVAPTFTELYMDDQVSLLKYYRGFATAHPVAADLKFIEREIQYAEYNYPMDDEALYTEASWARYKEAYDAAVAIAGSEKPSEVFSAKYELMVAMKGLLRKDNSANLNYEGYARLEEAKTRADELLAIAKAELVLTADAIAAGYTVDTALASVVRAYGYYYVGEDGNTWNLYNDSVLEYLDNDRPNKSTNWRRMDAASGALNNAVDLFENMKQEDVAPELGVVDGTTGAFYNVATDEAGFTTGYLFGVAPDSAVADYFALVDDTAGYTDITPSVANVDNGTGAVVNVYTNDDKLVAQYTLVIFGDVNGDGGITGLDYSFVKSAATGGDALQSGAYEFAGDVNGDGGVTGLDYSFVKSAATGGDALSVNPYVTVN